MKPIANDDHAALGGGRDGGMRTKPVSHETTIAATIELDAREFGIHVKQGGWRLGLLVARNVEPGAGAGERTDLEPRNDRSEVGKVSASRFAEQSQTSVPRVMRYLHGWE